MVQRYIGKNLGDLAIAYLPHLLSQHFFQAKRILMRKKSHKNSDKTFILQDDNPYIHKNNFGIHPKLEEKTIYTILLMKKPNCLRGYNALNQEKEF